MKIACISTFNNDLKALRKKPKDGYNKCLEDILAVIDKYPISELAQMGDALTPSIVPPDFHYRKIRIENSLNTGGRSSGFRLICVVSESADSIIFLTVYPKTGRLGINDINPKEKKRLIKEMVEENGRYLILDRETLEFNTPQSND